MPFRSYVCEKCEHRFDLLEGVTAEKSRRERPRCRSAKLKRTFSAFSVGSSSGGSCAPGTCSRR